MARKRTSPELNGPSQVATYSLSTLAQTNAGTSSILQVLRRGAISSFGVRVLSMGGMFVLHSLMARWMLPAEYGTYCYAVSIVPLLALLANLGLPLAAVRLVPRYQANDTPGLLKGFIYTSAPLVAVNSLVISLLLFSLLLIGGGGNIRTALLYALPMLMGFACLHLLQALLRGTKRIAASQLPEQILVPLGVLSGLVTMRVLQVELTGKQLLLVHAASLAVACSVVFVFVGKVLGPQLRQVKPQFDARDWLSISFPLAVSSGIWIAITRVDVIMIGALRDSADVAFYTLPQKLATLTYMGLTAMDSILSPMLAEHHAKGDKAKIQSLVTTTANWTLMGTVPLLVAFAIGGEWILSLFGDEYRQSATLLRIFLIGQLATLVVGPVDPIFTMLGHQKAYMKILAVTGIFTVALLPVFISYWGVVGAASAATLSLLCWKACLAWHAYRSTGLKSWAFASTS